MFLLQNYKLPKTKRKSVQSIKPKTKIDRDNIFPLSTILFTLKNHFLFFFFFYLGVTRGNWTTCKHLARPRLQHTNHWGQYSPISVFNIVFNFPPKFHNFNVFLPKCVISNNCYIIYSLRRFCGGSENIDPGKFPKSSFLRKFPVKLWKYSIFYKSFDLSCTCNAA